MLLKKGEFVRIREYLLSPEKRLSNVPEDTSKVPLKMWIKGELLEEVELFEKTRIKTATGRIVEGTVKEKQPKYKHNYGDFVEEIQVMRSTILTEMWDLYDGD